jgi:16S rRNA processing protein RimM
VRKHEGEYSSFRICGAVEHKKKALVAVEGIHDINSALPLVGCEVYITRTQLPDLPEGEFYWQDLLGLSVVDEQGRLVGVLANILVTGANDVYVVKNREKEYLIPAIDDVVLKIDLIMRTMTVRPMEGLLDL